MDPNTDLPVELQQKLQRLKEHLQTDILPMQNRDTPVRHNSAHFDMLPLIIQQVKQGGNLETDFPDFYHSLLKDSGLRQVFVDSLDAETAFMARQTASSQLKQTPTQSLARLAMTPAKIFLSAEGRWQATLQKQYGRIQAYFQTLSQQPVWRSTTAVLEWQTLMQSELKLQGVLFVLLFQVQPQGAQFSLRLDVATDSEPFPPMIAEVQWGTYSHKVNIKTSGLVDLPHVSAEFVFNHVTTAFTEDILITLTPIHDIPPAPS
ncbi:MAG: hypothetical protein ACPG8W_22480 [Candidatus Promineifilaceae bacterium]